MKQLQSPKEPAPMPSDFSESTEAKQSIEIKITPLEVKTSQRVSEEIALMDLVDPYDSPLHAAVRRGDSGMVAALLKTGANPNRTLN
ncbi:MAG: hypothetical protein JSR33_11430, partial [Proteobacteria bacterium]|nr:hypothetical protein [Pseudomonadota bacterium]